MVDFYVGKELTFYINEKKVVVEPFTKSEAEDVQASLFRAEINEDVNRYAYHIFVTLAFSKYFGMHHSDFFITNKSADIMFDVWYRGGSHKGTYNIYSDYLDMHSIDAGYFSKLKKDLK